MSAIDLDPELSLGRLVVEQPARAQVFDRLRLDYCCGGGRSLAEACAQRGLDIDTVQAALHTVETSASPHDVESTDWRTVSLGELCEHIITVHHDGLREAFPRIAAQLATVVRVHGAGDPRLDDAQHLFHEIRADLVPHLASEEDELFPACIAWEEHGSAVDEELIAGHEQEHASLGAGLAELRALCDDYDRAAAHCSTHRALMDALEAFEQDIHRHVHEENNILLVRVRGGQVSV